MNRGGQKRLSPKTTSPPCRSDRGVQSLPAAAFQYGRVTQSARTVYTTQHMVGSVDPDRKDCVPTRHRNRQTRWVSWVRWVAGRGSRADRRQCAPCGPSACACVRTRGVRVRDASYARTSALRTYVLPFDNHAIRTRKVKKK